MLGNLRLQQDQLRRLSTRGSRMAPLMPRGRDARWSSVRATFRAGITTALAVANKRNRAVPIFRIHAPDGRVVVRVQLTDGRRWRPLHIFYLSNT